MINVDNITKNTKNNKKITKNTMKNGHIFQIIRTEL